VRSLSIFCCPRFLECLPLREAEVFVLFALADFTFVLGWLVLDGDTVLLAGVAEDAFARVKASEHTRIVTLEATALFSHDPANLIQKPQSRSKAGLPLKEMG